MIDLVSENKLQSLRILSRQSHNSTIQGASTPREGIYSGTAENGNFGAHLVGLVT